MKYLKKIGPVFLIILLLAACGGPTPLNKNELRLAIEREMTTLNHQVTTSRTEIEQISQVMEGLTRYTKDKKIGPSGATSWDISNDFLTYTFHLNKNAKWENGENVTAADYVFAWRTLLTNPKAGYNYVLTILENGADVKSGAKDPEQLGIKALDDYTLEITLIQPYTPFLDAISTVTYYPLNEKAYMEIGADDYGTAANTILTNGAFKIKEYQPSSLIEFEKSQVYWDKANVKLDTVKVNIVGEWTTQSVMYDNNELDILRITSELADKYPSNDNTFQELDSRIIYLYVSGQTNPENALYGNKNFRQALAKTIDKEVITTNILKDGSKPLEGIIPEGFGQVRGVDFRTFTGNYQTKTQDLVEAKRLLALAKTELPANTPLELTIAVQENATYRKVFENIKAQIETNLPEVTVVLESIPNQLYFSQVMKKETAAGVGSWSAAFTDYFNFMELFKAGATFNYGAYDKPEYEALIEKASIEGDIEKQAEIYKQAEVFLVEDAVYIPLYQVGVTYELKDYVEGFVYNQVAPSIDYKFIEIV